MNPKRLGRPPMSTPTTVRMTKATQLRLRQLAKTMGMNQGAVINMALQRLYDAEMVSVPTS